MANAKISELPLLQKLGNTGAAPNAARSWDFGYTWNAAGTTFVGMFLNITNTASAAGSLICDWQVDTVSMFKVSKAGLVTSVGLTVTGHPTLEGVTSTGATGTGKFVFDGTPTLVTPVLGAATATSIGLPSGNNLSWNSDVIVGRRAAAGFMFGAADAAAPVAQTLSFQGARGGTDTNTAAVAATIQGSLGTGTGTVGDLVLSTGTVAASGTTQHTAAARLTLNSTTATLAPPTLAFPAAAALNASGALTVKYFGTTTLIFGNGAVDYAAPIRFPAASPDVAIARAGANALIFGDQTVTGAGAVTSRCELNKAVASIANNTATDVLTVTIPNAAHSCQLYIELCGSLGAGGAIGANEASATNAYTVTFTRTAGVNAVGAISAASGASACAVAGAATVTCVGTLSAVTGAVGASNSFTIKVTIARSAGSSTNHTCLVYAKMMNANATGITIA